MCDATPSGLTITRAGEAVLRRDRHRLRYAGLRNAAGCRARCLDWSERRHHLAGAVGAALLDRCYELGWARRAKDSRVVAFSPAGERAFQTAISA